MQLTINVDGRLVKKAAITALVVTPFVVFGAPASVPNSFQAGTPISAQQMNDNFGALTTSVDAIDTRLAALEAKTVRSGNGILAFAGTSVGDGALTKSYNSVAGGTVSLSTTAPGLYAVTFSNIDCGATTGTGMAVASAAGAPGLSCRVNGDWMNTAAGCRIFVGCFNGAGAAVATPISLIYVQ